MGSERNVDKLVFKRFRTAHQYKAKEFTKLWLDGSMQALADYRTFVASNFTIDNFNLLKFSESNVGDQWSISNLMVIISADRR